MADATSSLKKSTIAAAKWTIGGHAASQGVRLAANLILVRLVAPEAFGLMSLLSVVVHGLQMCSDIGIGLSVVKDQREDLAFLRTVWTLQVLRGCLLWLLAIALAGPLAWFYDDRALLWLVPVAGLTALVDGFSSIALYRVEKKLEIRLQVRLLLASQVIGSLVMLLWATVDRSIWALIAGLLATSATRLVASHTLLPRAPCGFAWDRKAAGEIVGFGRWIFLSTAVTYAASRSDRLILGRLTSWNLLGVYQFAFTLVSLSCDVSTRLTRFVLFPALSAQARSRTREFPERFREARRCLVAFEMAGLLGIFLLAPTFFQLLFPPNYHRAGVIAQLLVVPSWLLMLGDSCIYALLVLDDSRSVAWGNLVRAAFAVPCSWFGLQWWGVNGMILGLAIANLMALAVIQAALMRRIHTSVLGQDLAYTLLFCGLGAIGVLAPRCIGIESTARLPVTMLVSTILFALAGCWAVVSARDLWSAADATGIAE